MENAYQVAFLVYGEPHSGRDALTEDRYKPLAEAFRTDGCQVKSVLYHDSQSASLLPTLLTFDAVLVWVNPIEQGNDRKKLDALLARASEQGVLVSAHPEIILKMGTKDVLTKTTEMSWSGRVDLYTSFDDFQKRFIPAIEEQGTVVLKQYRGNGGNGVYKVMIAEEPGNLRVLHAKQGATLQPYSYRNFFEFFEPYFTQDGMLIQQEWNPHHANGMIRCYLSADKIAGFGYQEINALYENKIPGSDPPPPSQRYYFTEQCGLFLDLKRTMEALWVPHLQKILSIRTENLPVLWDADFFIHQSNSPDAVGKYTLCEINVSSVSPFPPSAVSFIVAETLDRIHRSKRV